MDLVVFSDDYDWAGHPSSSMHLFRALAREHRIFWFSVVYRFPTLTRYDIVRTMKKLREVGTSPANDGKAQNPRVWSPLMIPHFYHPVRSVNRILFRGLYRRIVREFGIREPAVIASNPFAVDFLPAVGAACQVYYCVDDYPEYPGIDRRACIRLESEILDVADLLVATSERLLVTRQRNRTGHYLPHGVDVEHFSSRAVDGEPGPPVIGFFGMLSKWVDLAYLARLARLRPDWRFKIIGRAEVPVDELRALGNVELTGRVTYSDLPRAAAPFSVGLIPFKVNDLTRAVNPLKLLEYFALGVPVVSTDLPEVAVYDRHVRIARTPEEAVESIQDLLSSDSVAAREERRRLARDNSWERRAGQLMEWIHDAGRRGRPAS